MKTYSEFETKNVDLVAVIGSTKYAYGKQMIKLSKVLQMQGHVPLMTPSVYEPESTRASEIDLMRESYKRIDICDRVIVASNYVGENTTREYQYALLVKHKLVTFHYDVFKECINKLAAFLFVDTKGSISLNRQDDCVGCICKYDYELHPIIKEYYGYDDTRVSELLEEIALNIYNIPSKDVHFISSVDFNKVTEGEIEISTIIEDLKI